MQIQADIEKSKYPTGKFSAPASYQVENVKKFIHALEVFPADLEKLVKGIPAKDLVYSYRPGGWNIKQIVHHVADSHLNFHIRTRLTLAEDKPTVKPYDENDWAKFADANSDNLEPSLQIIKGVHARTVELLRTLSEKDFARQFYHPEYKKDFSLLWLLSMYAWHGQHHAAQIKVALEHKF
jgi:hypothetical protein